MTTTIEVLKQMVDALEVGLDLATAEAERFHEAYAGYKQAAHKAVDDDVEQIRNAIAACRAEIARLEKVEPVAWVIRTDNTNLHELDPNKTCSWLDFDVEQFKHNAARSLKIVDAAPLYTHPAPSAEIEELERQLAECQRERDMLRKFHHDQQELHERNEANAQTNRLRLLQIVELRAACQMALDALESCINDPKMRHNSALRYTRCHRQTS